MKLALHHHVTVPAARLARRAQMIFHPHLTSLPSFLLFFFKTLITAQAAMLPTALVMIFFLGSPREQRFLRDERVSGSWCGSTEWYIPQLVNFKLPLLRAQGRGLCVSRHCRTLAAACKLKTKSFFFKTLITAQAAMLPTALVTIFFLGSSREQGFLRDERTFGFSCVSTGRVSPSWFSPKKCLCLQ